MKKEQIIKYKGREGRIVSVYRGWVRIEFLGPYKDVIIKEEELDK